MSEQKPRKPYQPFHARLISNIIEEGELDNIVYASDVKIVEDEIITTPEITVKDIILAKDETVIIKKVYKDEQGQNILDNEGNIVYIYETKVGDGVASIAGLPVINSYNPLQFNHLKILNNKIENNKSEINEIKDEIQILDKIIKIDTNTPNDKIDIDYQNKNLNKNKILFNIQNKDEDLLTINKFIPNIDLGQIIKYFPENLNVWAEGDTENIQQEILQQEWKLIWDTYIKPVTKYFISDKNTADDQTTKSKLAQQFLLDLEIETETVRYNLLDDFEWNNNNDINTALMLKAVLIINSILQRRYNTKLLNTSILQLGRSYLNFLYESALFVYGENEINTVLNDSLISISARQVPKILLSDDFLQVRWGIQYWDSFFKDCTGAYISIIKYLFKYYHNDNNLTPQKYKIKLSNNEEVNVINLDDWKKISSSDDNDLVLNLIFKIAEEIFNKNDYNILLPEEKIFVLNQPAILTFSDIKDYMQSQIEYSIKRIRSRDNKISWNINIYNKLDLEKQYPKIKTKEYNTLLKKDKIQDSTLIENFINGLFTKQVANSSLLFTPPVINNLDNTKVFFSNNDAENFDTNNYNIGYLKSNELMLDRTVINPDTEQYLTYYKNIYFKNILKLKLEDTTFDDLKIFLQNSTVSINQAWNDEIEETYLSQLISEIDLNKILSILCNEK